MIYKGIYRDGVVILTEPIVLRNGQRVEVFPGGSRSARKPVKKPRCDQGRKEERER